MTRFTISDESIRKRNRNVLLGGLFSLLLAGVVTYGHYESPDRYNQTLLWSVLGFVLIGNLVNFYRHLRYLRLSRDHRIEVYPGSAQFWTAGDKTELDLKDVAGLFFYRRRGELQHIQVRLKNNRGIRLEGYADLEHLAAELGKQLPEGHVVDKGKGA